MQKRAEDYDAEVQKEFQFYNGNVEALLPEYVKYYAIMFQFRNGNVEEFATWRYAL